MFDIGKLYVVSTGNGQTIKRETLQVVAIEFPLVKFFDHAEREIILNVASLSFHKAEPFTGELPKSDAEDFA